MNRPRTMKFLIIVILAASIFGWLLIGNLPDPNQRPSILAFQVEGNIKHGNPTAGKLTTLSNMEKIIPGEHVISYEDGSAVFRLDSGTTTVKMAPLTSLKFLEADQEENQAIGIELESGNILVTTQGTDLGLSTPTSYAFLTRKNSILEASVSNPGGEVTFHCLAGTCLVENRAHSAHLSAGEYAVIGNLFAAWEILGRASEASAFTMADDINQTGHNLGDKSTTALNPPITVNVEVSMFPENTFSSTNEEIRVETENQTERLSSLQIPPEDSSQENSSLSPSGLVQGRAVSLDLGLGTWYLIAYGPPFSLTPTPEALDITLLYDDDGAMSGFSGCNWYMGKIATTSDNRISILSPLYTTKMSCREDGAEYENAYLSLISQMDNYQIDNSTLQIFTKNNQVLVYQQNTPSRTDLWVDADNGSDGNDGRTYATAFRTIQKAAVSAVSGTTVHILPGVYRESVRPANSGSILAEIEYLAENGAGTVKIRGSEPSSSLTWTQLTSNTIGLPAGVNPTNIYYTNLSSWNLEGPPRFVVELDNNGEILSQLPLAREPDWQVSTEWKHHEFWWAAEGGSDVAGCYPPTNPDPRNCDNPSRSTNQLTDPSNDTTPTGIEPGNLTTLGDLTGATIRVIEAVPGHWLYRRTIASHNVSAGRITLDSPTGTSLGWGSKYYVEGLAKLLDSPGEWWYDENSGGLYLWPRTAGNPGSQNLEISRLENGFDLADRSYTTLDGLGIEFFEGNAVSLINGINSKSHIVTVRNAELRYADFGVWLHQAVREYTPFENMIYGFTLENSEIGYMDSQALFLRSWWENNAAANSFTRSGIQETTIRGNEMHHLGFNAVDGSDNGARLLFVDKMRFENNHIHDVAHNGIMFSRSVIQSSKNYNFNPGEIKTGEILIKENIFEQACQLTMDCGGLKLWGYAPDNSVFREMLITGNIFRDTIGWTYTSEQRGIWSGGESSDVQGMGGFGLYLDHVSGVHAYRNIAYNNSHFNYMFTGNWQDGDIIYYNNISANSLHGFRLWGDDDHSHVNTQVVNNILINHEGYGISFGTTNGNYSNVTIDHNLYYNNGWRHFEDGGLWNAGNIELANWSGPNEYHETIAEIRANTPWEDHGVEGNPIFENYDLGDYDIFDGSWPDFHLTGASVNALDKGTANLPASLSSLLELFNVTDYFYGDAYDIGRFEVIE